MSTIIFQPSSDSFLGSQQRWFPFLTEVAMGLGTEIMEEMHCMEQFFIKLQNIYAFVCQWKNGNIQMTFGFSRTGHIMLVMFEIDFPRFSHRRDGVNGEHVCFFIICDSLFENKELTGSKGDKSVVIALTTILFYSVFSYFATRLRDIWRRSRARSIQTTPSMRNYLKWLCKIILEWAKAVIVVLCLREQGIHYEPKLGYSVATFSYYLCTEKVFLEIFPALVELLNIDKMENLEHLYIPLSLNVLATVSGGTLAVYAMYLRYSHFVLLSLYFLVYLRVKDAYYNYWELIIAERETYSSFRTATEKEIQDWADICAVCLSNMSRARITPCNHLFHPWFKEEGRSRLWDILEMSAITRKQIAGRTIKVETDNRYSLHSLQKYKITIGAVKECHQALTAAILIYNISACCVKGNAQFRGNKEADRYL
ncbi:hypothetical protein NQ318_008330, partial [Aromia moschata]